MQKTETLTWLFPENVRRVEKQSTKAGRCLLGYMLRNFQRGPEVWARLANVSFLPHDLVTGGIPHTGSRQPSAYLRLLIFLLAILIPARASSSPAFLMMYSAWKLNKHSDNIQPWRTPFPIWNQSVVPCPVLAVASWPAYRFLKRQVRWSGIPISFRIFHSLLWSIQSEALA